MQMVCPLGEFSERALKAYEILMVYVRSFFKLAFILLGSQSEYLRCSLVLGGFGVYNSFSRGFIPIMYSSHSLCNCTTENHV